MVVDDTAEPNALRQRVRDWIDEEELEHRALPTNERVEFAFDVQMFGVHLTLIKPVGRSKMVLHAATKISPKHQEALVSGRLERFLVKARLFLTQQNLGFSFRLEEFFYVIEEVLFLDALTQDAFFRCLRRLVNCHKSLQILVAEATGTHLGDSGPEAGNFESMFT
jgi:hypothetical protein